MKKFSSNSETFLAPKIFRKILKMFRKTLNVFSKILKMLRKTLKIFHKILKMFHKALKIEVRKAQVTKPSYAE